MKRVANIICKIEVNNNNHIYGYDFRGSRIWLRQTRLTLSTFHATLHYRKRVSLDPTVKVSTSYVCDCKQWWWNFLDARVKRVWQQWWLLPLYLSQSKWKQMNWVLSWEWHSGSIHVTVISRQQKRVKYLKWAAVVGICDEYSQS